MDVMDVVSPILLRLQVPEDFTRYQNLTDILMRSKLDEWRNAAEHNIGEIQVLLGGLATLSLDLQADVISKIAVFTSEDPWSSPIMQQISIAILRRYDDPPTSLIRCILTEKLKPIFQANPNPFLNVSTGRMLTRPAGGPMGVQDFYDDQAWKRCPGVSNLVSWCVRNLHSEAYENLWHLIIPPVMALLDDYEARYRCQGAKIISVMLSIVPRQLLKKTGVDGLIRQSLSVSLTHLQSLEVGLLIEAAVSASVSLTLLTTDAGSAERFDQLCALLGESIINGIWLYASNQEKVVFASLDALPPLIRALGVGSARYFKPLIVQVMQILIPSQLHPWPVELQMASLHVLSTLIVACPPCLPCWRTTILNGIGMCWVGFQDTSDAQRGPFVGDLRSFSKVGHPVSAAASWGMKKELRNAISLLEEHCPSTETGEYRRFLDSLPSFDDDDGGTHPAMV